MVTTSEIEPAEPRFSTGYAARARAIESMPPMENPFRTPDILQKHNAVKVGALLRSARGVQYMGIDRKVLIYLAVHFGIALLLATTDTYIAQLWSAGILPHHKWTSVNTQALLLTLSLGGILFLYSKVYASDPGWVTPKNPHIDPTKQPCTFCGSKPTTRSRHSKHTGQCVHKYDHFCWILSTDIGDANHRLFFLFITLENVLIILALCSAVQSAVPCLFSTSAPARCAQHHPATEFILLLLAACLEFAVVFTGYLWLLHSYLAMTGQTTYEVVTGGKGDTLAPYFQGRTTGNGYKLPDKFAHLIWDDMWGKGPPKPFSRGVFMNIWIFFGLNWPRWYPLQLAVVSDRSEMEQLV